MALLGFGLIAAGCARDKGPFTAPDTPRAYVRFVNAVTDTNAVDFRFVDMIEGSAYYQHASFRSISAYQGTNAGSRHVTVFAVDPDEAKTHVPRVEIVTQVLKDTTITLEAGKYYTLLMTGTQRNKQSYINVIEDARGTSPSGAQIAVHAINAGADPVDVYALATATSPISGSAAAAALSVGKAQPYVIRPTGAFAFGATMSGSTSVLAAAAAPAGAAPASSSQSALGGYTIGGSYLTAFIFPRGVAGSLATPTTAAVVWIQDNAPMP